MNDESLAAPGSENQEITASTRVRGVLAEASYSGPIPHPTFLEKYEEILPGSAERLIKMVESEQAHAQQMETILVNSQVEDKKAERTERRIGQVFALAYALAALGAGA